MTFKETIITATLAVALYAAALLLLNPLDFGSTEKPDVQVIENAGEQNPDAEIVPPY